MSLIVKSSSLHGAGVYTKAPIRKGERVLEALIRRRINPRVEAMVHTVGLVVLLAVLVLVSFKDVTRVFGRG